MTITQREQEIKYLVNQRNHLTAEIVKTKRTIDALGDNEYIIKYLASLEYSRDLYEAKINSLLA